MKKGIYTFMLTPLKGPHMCLQKLSLSSRLCLRQFRPLQLPAHQN